MNVEWQASQHIGVSDARAPSHWEGSAHAAFLATGNPRPVLNAALESIIHGRRGVLALVLETEGSTYAGVGDMVLFDDDLQVGWLSGGCLEPQLAQRALHMSGSGAIDWVEIDTRSDDELLTGSALGCRGRLRIALLPLRSMPGIDVLLHAWLNDGVTLSANVRADAVVELQAGSQRRRWLLISGKQPWSGSAAGWRLALPRLPRLLVLGAGPETPTLIPLLLELGWWVGVAERRARWKEAGHCVDAFLRLAPAAAIHDAGADAVLVMHHDFELDREALAALAGTDTAFIGLLGPRRRRDDLLKLLTSSQRDSLASRLRAPVGLDLGGRGAEVIALSIAAQLQQWRVTVAPP